MKLPIPDNIFGMLDSLLGKINKRTATAIRQGYMFLIFILVIAGIVIGYRKGAEKAHDSSLPLPGDMKSIFELDMRKERGEGSFSSMLESELTSELKVSAQAKRQFPTREELQPELHPEILEAPDGGAIVPRGSSEIEKQGMYEGTYDRTGSEPSEVAPLQRAEKPRETTEPVIDRSENLPPLEKPAPAPPRPAGREKGLKKISPSGPGGIPEPLDRGDILE